MIIMNDRIRPRQKVFPNEELIEIPITHSLFNQNINLKMDYQNS